MRLNPEVPYVLRQQEGWREVSDRMMHELPSMECFKYPTMLVVEHNGAYYMVKSRPLLLGEPCPPEAVPVNPYDLEYTEYTLRELRNVCNPSTQYKLPEDFIGSNVLIHL